MVVIRQVVLKVVLRPQRAQPSSLVIWASRLSRIPSEKFLKVAVRSRTSGSPRIKMDTYIIFYIYMNSLVDLDTSSILIH